MKHEKHRQMVRRSSSDIEDQNVLSEKIAEEVEGGMANRAKRILYAGGRNRLDHMGSWFATPDGIFDIGRRKHSRFSLRSGKGSSDLKEWLMFPSQPKRL